MIDHLVSPKYRWFIFDVSLHFNGYLIQNEFRFAVQTFRGICQAQKGGRPAVIGPLQQ